MISFVRSFPRSFVTLSFRFLVLPAFLCNFSFRFLVLSFIFPSSLCHFTLSSSYHCIFPSPIRLFFLSPVACLQSCRVQSVRHSVTLSFRVFSSSSLRPSFRRQFVSSFFHPSVTFGPFIIWCLACFVSFPLRLLVPFLFVSLSPCPFVSSCLRRLGLLTLRLHFPSLRPLFLRLLVPFLFVSLSLRPFVCSSLRRLGLLTCVSPSLLSFLPSFFVSSSLRHLVPLSFKSFERVLFFFPCRKLLR